MRNTHPWITMESAGILATMLGGILVALAATVIWIYTTFASKEYVDQADKSVAAQISDIKETLKVIDQRTYDMNGREGPPPKK